MKITKAECLEFLRTRKVNGQKNEHVYGLFVLVERFKNKWPTADQIHKDHSFINALVVSDGKTQSINHFTRREFGRMAWAKNEIKRRDNVRKAQQEEHERLYGKTINCRCVIVPAQKYDGPQPKLSGLHNIPPRPFLAEASKGIRNKVLAEKVGGGRVAGSDIFNNAVKTIKVGMESINSPTWVGIDWSEIEKEYKASKLKAEQEEKQIKEIVEHFNGVWPVAIDQGEAGFVGVCLKDYNSFDLNGNACIKKAGDIVPLWSGYEKELFGFVIGKKQFEKYVQSQSLKQSKNTGEFNNMEKQMKERDSNADLKGFIPEAGSECVCIPDNTVWGFDSIDVYKGRVMAFDGEWFWWKANGDLGAGILSRTDKVTFEPVKTERQKAIEFYLGKVSAGMVKSVYKANEKDYWFAVESLIDSGYLNTKTPPVSR